MNKRLKYPLISLVLTTTLAALPVAAELVGPKTPSSKWVDEAKQKLGSRAAAREEYFAGRRASVDKDANVALLRLSALETRQQLERSISGGPTIPAWSAFGPAPINGGQTPTSTPRFPSDVSGRTVALAFDPVNEHVYIGAAQGGIWRSTNNGATWTPLSDTLASTAVGAIAVVPPATAGNPATIYLGTGESSGSCDSYAGVGLYKSVDGGATWTGPISSAEFANRAIASIAVDRTDPNRVLLTTSSGIFGNSCVSAPTLPARGVFLSTNGGTTWTKQTAANRRFAVILQDPIVATTWWAGGRTSSGSIEPTAEGGLVKSVDNGVTWTQVAGTGGLPALSTAWGRTWLTATSDPDFPGQSILYIGTALTTGTTQGSVFKSVDSGATWTEVVAARGYCSGQCSYDNPVWVEPGEEQIFYTGGAGASTVGALPSSFMRTNNGGTSFADKVRSSDATTALHADVHFIATWPGQPNRLWVTNDGGVWRSDDRGDNWVNVNSNLQTTQFSACDLHPFDAGVVYAGSQDNGTEGRIGTNNWKHLDFGDGGYALIDQQNPNNLVHTYFNQSNNLIGAGFTNDGFNATMGMYLGSFAPGNGIALSDRVQFYAPIHLDRGNRQTLYFGTNRLWKAQNFFVTGGTGNEFSALNAAQDLTGGTIGSSAGASLTAIETFANPTPGGDAAIIFTGASNGVVFRSIDGGSNWTQVDVGGSAIFVSDIRIDPSNSNVIYQSRSGFAASAGLNVRKSTDGGNTWAPAATGLPNVPVNALTFDPSTDGRLWAGTDVGTFYTEDGGANWVPHNTGIPNTAVFDLDANPATGMLVACTHGRGAFSIQLPLGPSIFRDGFEN